MESEYRKRNCQQSVASVDAVCIAEINDEFFLLVEIDIEAPGVEIEQVLVFRITPGQAEALMDAGIEECRIVNEIPSRAEFRCVLVVEDQAFLVFEIENHKSKLVLVRADLCPIIG